jgi:hypothetical protein
MAASKSNLRVQPGLGGVRRAAPVAAWRRAAHVRPLPSAASGAAPTREAQEPQGPEQQVGG